MFLFVLLHLMSTLCLYILSFILFHIIKIDLHAAVLQTSGQVLIKSRVKQQQGQSGEQCRGKQNQLFMEITHLECLLIHVAIAKKKCCNKPQYRITVPQFSQVSVFDKEAD